MKKGILFFICLILTLFTITACGKVTVSWLDADGTLLYIEKVPSDLIPQKELPADNDEWHYTAWKYLETGTSSITYIAERVANRKVTWKNTEGVTITECYVPLGDEIPEQDLPKDSDIWNYTGWHETKDGNHYTYTAERQPQESYFVGNVFQIIVKDLGGTPIATGTGFVFNKDGWFITNSHVMEDGYEATAIFEIKNSNTGESFTSLPITKGYYNHSDKDIFIGKIDNYSKISGHYKTISFEQEHTVGEKTYSVGYPNSSINLEVHAGHITGDLSSLYDKLYSGVSYIASDSYIAPGSSGGILLNENLKVIGITTLGLGEGEDFEMGASIEAYNFTVQTTSINNDGLQDLATFLHPNEKTFIQFFRSLETYSNSTKKEDDNGVYYELIWKTEGVNSSDTNYSYEKTLQVHAWGWIKYHTVTYWASGSDRTGWFYGKYTNEDELDNFYFSMIYGWKSGDWYNISSDNINYSENINLTLRNHKVDSSYGFYPSTSNINYAKECFNSIYSWIYDWIATYK